jgi:hypothetical protein
MEDQVTWAKLDPFGQVTGKPFVGDVDGLVKFARKGVADLATFTQKDDFRYYDHPTGRVITCTVVTMTLPWGEYRFIPEDAPDLAATNVRRRRRRQPWPR